ncbi:response regulator [Massilia sp. H6]|uniref:response regulator n=1 Tax=Massilia sp. H6 TaxID=2970464 RepID=UPI00216A5A09|nr:response regulator [Massilia sp. H6]UVW29414.1 response regulator [Massilia sp. H6]
MILIADDDSDFAENCSMMLELHGYDVSVVASGTQALETISSQEPELLISDCSMPGMTGLELSQELKARPSCKPLPILLMSGSLKCKAAPGTSYDAFLRKPFLAEELLFAVRTLLPNGARAPSVQPGY